MSTGKIDADQPISRRLHLFASHITKTFNKFAARAGLGKRSDYLWLVAIIATGAVLRLAALGNRPLWIDETLTITDSRWNYLHMWTVSTNSSPPLFYTINKLLFGHSIPSPFLLRLFPATVGILTIPVLYKLGEILAGKKAGLAAAALLAVYAPHVIYSEDARTYTLLYFFVALSAVFLARYLRQGNGTRQHNLKYLLLYALTSSAAFSSHYTAIFWVFVSLIILFFCIDDRRQRIKTTLLAMSVLTVLSLPAASLFYQTISTHNDFDWLHQPSLGHFLKIASRFFLPTAIWRFQPVPDLITALGFMVAAAQLRKNRLLMVFAISLIAICPLLWSAGLVKPVFLFRTALVSSIGVILIFSTLLATGKRLYISLYSAIIALFLISSIHTVRYLKYTNYQSAALFLEHHVQPGDKILLCNARVFPGVAYYLPKPYLYSVYGVVNKTRVVHFYRPNELGQPWPRVFMDSYFKKAVFDLRHSKSFNNLGEPARLTLLDRKPIWTVDDYCSFGLPAGSDSSIVKKLGHRRLMWHSHQMYIYKITRHVPQHVAHS